MYLGNFLWFRFSLRRRAKDAVVHQHPVKSLHLMEHDGTTDQETYCLLLKCYLCVGPEDSHEDLLDNDKKESTGQEDVGEIDHRGGLRAVHWTKPVRQSWWEEGTNDARLFGEGKNTVSDLCCIGWK